MIYHYVYKHYIINHPTYYLVIVNTQLELIYGLMVVLFIIFLQEKFYFKEILI